MEATITQKELFDFRDNLEDILTQIQFLNCLNAAEDESDISNYANYLAGKSLMTDKIENSISECMNFLTNKLNKKRDENNA